MKEKRINEIKAVIFIATAVIIFASLISFTPLDLKFYTSHPNIPAHNFIRTFGAYLGGLLLFLFGWSCYALPLFIFYLGIRLFKQEKPDIRLARIVGLLIFLLSLSSLTGVFITKSQPIEFSRAGFLGYLISNTTISYFGKLGAAVIFIALALLSLVLVTDILISSFFLGINNKIKLFFALLFKNLSRKKIKTLKIKPLVSEKKQSLVSEVKPRIVLSKQETIEKEIPKKLPLEPKPKIQIKTPLKVEDIKVKQEASAKIENYQLPSLDLLDSPPPLEARQIKEDLANNAKILEETLADFGISVLVKDIEQGPVITRYELEPAAGVKVNRIVALGDDIALAMKAQSVRIVAPIPGKARVGVEVPNSHSSIVYLKEVLSSGEFQKSDSRLALALGKDIAGETVIADLVDMPHLLIAGTTGSGKTVCVNAVILSLLFKYTPAELKFMMIDPKMVELACFNGLPHLLCPVVTEAKKASSVLRWVVNEMEERYQLLAKAGARNIEGYNEKNETLPYIIVVIDEFADLMVVAPDQIENAVTRLAQLSRAVGIHLILATQRPSVDVITGVIKANLPARISFKVASKVDSRTVLDMNGADKLLGKGDLLFLRPEESKLTRAQGTLVSDQEIERVVKFINSQAEPIYDEDVLKEQQKTNISSNEKDEIYDEAVRIIMESNQASVSILQRRLRLGYTRAARIIDMMEQEGLIGAFEGSKPRKIIVDRESWLKKGLEEKESDGISGNTA